MVVRGYSTRVEPSDRITEIFHRICLMAGSRTILEDVRKEAETTGVSAAIHNKDKAAIYDWLLTEFNFQGVSNHAAEVYLGKHGHVRWEDIEHNSQNSQCEHLQDFRSLLHCRYDKISFTCSEPELIGTCPLPAHRLRNGRLNRTAYSLYRFIQDHADGNIDTWIDQRLARRFASSPARQASLIEPMRDIYGVSDKVLTMSLSILLMGVGILRPRWFAAGKVMIAVDTLIHNMFCRTGLLYEYGKPHAYGAACYRPGGCADLIWNTAQDIDARLYNPSFPRLFPRFVQHALWRYCAQSELNISNGNRIEDSRPCDLQI